MILEITDGKKPTYYYSNILKSYGFVYSNKKWKIRGKKSEIKQLKKYFSSKHLSCLMYDDKYERSAEYRKEFFKRNNKESYRCAYCGRKIKRNETTIDHIIPVRKAQKNTISKLLLKVIHNKTVNDYNNLTPCCSKCNKRKGQRVSLKYIYKGITGKTSSGITVRRICFFVSLFYIAVDVLLLFLYLEQTSIINIML